MSHEVDFHGGPLDGQRKALRSLLPVYECLVRAEPEPDDDPDVIVVLRARYRRAKASGKTVYKFAGAG